MTALFEVGKTYSTRSMGDHTIVYSWTVVSRTAKFVTATDCWGKPGRFGVKVDEHGEWALPAGSYSMCPVIHAASDGVL